MTRKIAYSRNAKIANAEILKTYFTYNFLLPILNYPYLVIFERVDLKFTQDKFGKNRPREIEIIRKSNFANANFPIVQDCLIDKTSNAYNLPILYNGAILD